MTSRATAGRQGGGEDGRAHTREVKLAVFFTQDELDKDGRPVRDRASVSRSAPSSRAMPPIFVLGKFMEAAQKVIVGLRRSGSGIRSACQRATACPCRLLISAATAATRSAVTPAR